MKFTFDTLNKTSTVIANGTLANIQTKTKVRDNIISMAALSCESYANDPVFKKQIDSYLKHMRSNTP